MQGKYTDEAAFRQRMMKYAQAHSITETADRYRCSRKTVHKWLKRWDGTKESLQDRSRRPKQVRRIHDEKTIRKIRKRLKQCRWTDLLAAFQLSKERDGYPGSYGAFKAIARKLKDAKPKPKAKRRKLKEYRRADYPGQKVQSVHVRFMSDTLALGQVLLPTLLKIHVHQHRRINRRSLGT